MIHRIAGLRISPDNAAGSRPRHLMVEGPTRDGRVRTVGNVPLWVWVLAALNLASAVGYYFVFHRSRDWARKERWFKPVAVVATVAYVTWLAFGSRRPPVVGVFYVVLAVTAARHTRFCHRCGRTNVLRGNPRRRHCRECGLDLTTQSAGAA